MRQVSVVCKVALSLCLAALLAASSHASDIEPVHLSPSAPVWLPAEQNDAPQLRTVFQNPQNLNPGVVNPGFQQSPTPILDATRDAAQDVGRWGAATARDVGQGTRNVAEGVVNGVRDSLQATGQALTNVVDNTVNVGNDRYYQQRQSNTAPAPQFGNTVVQPPSPIAKSFSSPTLATQPNNTQPTLQQPALQTQPQQPFTPSQGQTSGFATAPLQQPQQSAQPLQNGANPQTAPGFESGLRFTQSRTSAQQQATTAPAFGTQNQFATPTRQSQLSPVQPQTAPVQPQTQGQLQQPQFTQQAPQSSWDTLPQSNFPEYRPQQQAPAQQPLQFADTPASGWGTSPATTPATQQQPTQPATNLATMDQNKIGFAVEEPQTQTTESAAAASNTLIMLGLGLIGSLALNLFVGTSYLDVRNKYRSALRRSPRDFRPVAA